MLNEAEPAALERVRAVTVAPPTVARHDDLRLLVAVIDRLDTAPDFAEVADRLRALMDRLATGDIGSPPGLEGGQNGAVVALERLSPHT